MSKSLYVGNLPYSVTENDLRELFGEYEPVAVRVIGDKGFGFVDVPDEKAADAINAINGKEIGGRQIVVNEARPKTDTRRRWRRSRRLWRRRRSRWRRRRPGRLRWRWWRRPSLVEQSGGQQLTCEQCNEPFVYSDAERARDERAGYPLPRACPACVQQRRSAGAAKRAAKRPRRHGFRR